MTIGTPQIHEDGRRRGQFAILFAMLWALLGVVALLTGVYTYLVLNGQNLDDSIYHTLQLFYLKGERPEFGPIPYNIARFTAASLFFFPVVALGIGLFAGMLWGALLRYWVSRHVVIIGLGTHGMRFAALYREAGKTVVVVESDPDNPHLPTARDLGAYIVLGDATERSRLVAAKVHKAERVIVQTSTDTTDMAIVARLEKLLREKRYVPAQKLPVAVMLSDTSLLRGLQLASLKRKAFPLERSHFSVRDLTAHEIIKQPRFVEGLTAPSPHVLLFGYGALGEEMLEALATTWTALGGGSDRKLPVTVIAPGAPTVVRKDLNLLPYLEQFLSVTLIDHDWETVGLDTTDGRTIQTACREATVAVVLEEDREAGLRLGIEANNLKHRVGQQFPVFCLFETDLAGELDDAGDPNGILSFDIRSQVLTRANIESGQLIERFAARMCQNWTAVHTPPEAEARGFFGRMLRGAPPVARPYFPAGEWDELTDAERLVWRRRAEECVGALETCDLRVQRRQSTDPIRTLDDDTAAAVAEVVGRATGRTLPANWRRSRDLDAAGILAAVRQWPTMLMEFGFEVVIRQRGNTNAGKTTYTLYPAKSDGALTDLTL